jgi:hypothetical protein
MPINRTQFNLLVDDDGSNLVGTIWDKAHIKDVILDPVDAALIDPASAALYTVVTSSATGTVYNWAPGLLGHTIIRWIGSADLTITGMAGGRPGQLVTFKHIGSAGTVIRCPYFDSGSVAANRFVNIASSAPLAIAALGSATYVYNGPDTRWDLISHDQGAWITPPYSAANFTGGSGMTWTVDSADVLNYAYQVRGRTMSIAFFLASTSVGGTLGVELKIAVPGGFKTAQYAEGVYRAKNAGGTPTMSVMAAAPAGAVFSMYNTAAIASWSAAAHNTDLYGSFTCEVQ